MRDSPPHPPNPLLPHGEKGESGRPDGWNGRWRAGACQNIYPPAPFSHKGRRGSLGVLMAGTGDGAQGLAKTSTPSPTSRGAYRIIAVLTKIGLVGQGCTGHRKQTPCAPSLRVLRVSVRIRPAHAEARRRGDGERSSHKSCWTGLRLSLQAGASRDTALPDRVQRI